MTAVFHKNETALYTGNLIETQVTKKLSALRLGIEKQMGVSPLDLNSNQMAHHPIEQPLSLTSPVYGQTAHRAAKAAPCGHQLPVLIKEAASVVQISISLNTLLFQKSVYLFLCSCIAGGDGGQYIIHKITSWLQYNKVFPFKKVPDPLCRTTQAGGAA